MKLYDNHSVGRTNRSVTDNSPFPQAPNRAFKIFLSVRVSMSLPTVSFEHPIDQFSRNFAVTFVYNQ